MLALSTAALGWNAAALAPQGGVVSRTSAPTMMAKSQSLPFLEAPAHLDGTYAGDVGFDPLGLGGAYNMKWMREAELKHGRVCMLAVLGFAAVDRGFLAPGAPAVSSLAAHDVTVKSGHMLLLLFTVGVFEALSYSAIAEMMSDETDRAPGDYGLDFSNFGKDPKAAERYAMQEINHGRLAMLGFSGMVTQAALTGGPFPYTG